MTQQQNRYHVRRDLMKIMKSKYASSEAKREAELAYIRYGSDICYDESKLEEGVKHHNRN